MEQKSKQPDPKRQPRIKKCEAERRYAEMQKMKEERKGFYNFDPETPRVNIYTCPAGHRTKTIDRQPGTTPMFIPCSVCDRSASSSMYRVHPDEPTPITLEWYEPTLQEVQNLRSEPGVLEHVFAGGLLSRKVTPDESEG